MHILLTSDLGLDSISFLALAEGLQLLGEVTIWLPQIDWSQREVSHRAKKSIRVEQVTLANGIGAWCCTGTPSQTIALALATRSPDEIDLIVSGINTTPHTLPTMAHSMSYSGGVLAASEGLVWNIPGLAVSLDNAGDSRAMYETAVAITQQVIEEQMQVGLPLQLTNITVPAVPPEQWERVKRPLTVYYQHLREQRAQRLVTPNHPPHISQPQIITLTLPTPLTQILGLAKPPPYPSQQTNGSLTQLIARLATS